MEKYKSNIDTRKYQKSDKENLIKLIRLNTPNYFDQSEEKEFDEYLEKYKEDYFVVENTVENRLIGCGGINYFLNEPISLARISWDIIHPDFQGKGVGKKLLLHRIEHIRRKNIKLIVVRTSQLAYKFYQKTGFELKKVEKDFWAKGFDLYQMQMNL